MSLAVRGGSIRRAVDGWLDAADRKRIRIADIGSAKAQTAFVRAGLGWSIVSEVAARESATAGRLDLPRRRSGRYRFLAAF